MLSLVRDIRHHERRDTAGAFLVLFGIMAGHSILETARDALFLAEIPASRLPWVYLGIAAFALVITSRPRATALTGHGRSRLSGWLLASALVTLTLWALVLPDIRWALYVLYGWAGVFGTLVVVRYWVLVEGLFTVTQAKRLFSFIGVGSVLGALVGSAVARMLAGSFGAISLLPMAAAIFLATSLLLPYLLRHEPAAAAGAAVQPDSGEDPLRQAMELVLTRPYIRRVGSILLVSTVALTLVDYLFKSIVGANIPADELGSFFASTYLMLNSLSLFTQLFLGSWLLRAFGVSRALALLPSLLLFGGAGVALGGGMLAALILKGADGSLRYSVHRTAMEVLYVPLSTELRNRVKVVMEAIGQRGGQAIASVLILLVVPSPWERPLLGTAAALLAGAWLVLADNLQGHYLELFRSTLRERVGRARDPYAQLDLASLESLIAALSSSDDAEVVTALELLAERGKTRLVPLLILYHPSRRVLLLALELFLEAGRQDLVPMARRLLKHPDPEVRAAALRALSALDRDEKVLSACLEDPAPVVHVTALAGLAACGAPHCERAIESIASIARSGSAESRVALARALQHQHVPAFEEVLLGLASDPSPEVLLHVVHAMEHHPSRRYLPALLPLLARHELRSPVREALLTHGKEALEFLEQALGDPGTPDRVRRHLPRTICRFDAREARRILLPRLLAEPDGRVRYKILRALGSLRSKNPSLPLDARLLEAALESNLGRAFQLLNWRVDLERGASHVPERRTPVHDLLLLMLHNKGEHAVERVFRLLGLLHPREDLHRVHRALTNGDPEARASALELLANLLSPRVREALLGYLDDVSDERRLATAGIFHPARSAEYTALLEDMLIQGGTTLPALAAYHIGELRLVGMKPRLAAIESQAPTLLRAALRRAVQLMTRAASEGMAYGR